MGKIHYGFAHAMRLSQRNRADAKSRQKRDKQYRRIGKERQRSESEESQEEDIDYSPSPTKKDKEDAEVDDSTTITLSNQTFSKSIKTAILGFFMILRFAWGSLLLHSQDPYNSFLLGNMYNALTTATGLTRLLLDEVSVRSAPMNRRSKPLMRSMSPA